MGLELCPSQPQPLGLLGCLGSCGAASWSPLQTVGGRWSARAGGGSGCLSPHTHPGLWEAALIPPRTRSTASFCTPAHPSPGPHGQGRPLQTARFMSLHSPCQTPTPGTPPSLPPGPGGTQGSTAAATLGGGARSPGYPFPHSPWGHTSWADDRRCHLPLCTQPAGFRRLNQHADFPGFN